jgi:hypothetical protein
MRRGFVSRDGELGVRDGEGTGCSTRLLYTSFASALSVDCERKWEETKWKMEIKT